LRIPAARCDSLPPGGAQHRCLKYCSLSMRMREEAAYTAIRCVRLCEDLDMGVKMSRLAREERAL